MQFSQLYTFGKVLQAIILINSSEMAVETSPSQVLDLLFDEDCGVLARELDQGHIEPPNFVSLCIVRFVCVALGDVMMLYESVAFPP